MNTGMLWFDNDPRTDIATKIHRAADYYMKKYGQRPDLCFIHPSMDVNATRQQDGIEVRSNQLILPNHFWLGIHQVV